MSNIPTINENTNKKEVIDFIKKKINESNADGIVIGLSGGLDSSITTYLSCEAIGSEKVLGISLPSKTTPKEDIEHGQLIAKKLGIKYLEINIDNILNEYKKSLNFKENDSKIAIGNLIARVRMIILYFYANLNNYIVGGTSNKSELLIGYFTKHGDGACDMEPIGHIYKSQIEKLANKWELPQEIIEKPPRAGLWINQTDEEEIGMPYNTLDSILYMLIDEDKNPEEIASILEIPIRQVENIKIKIEKNKHKNKIPERP